MDQYTRFLEAKRIREQSSGFEPLVIPDFLFDFQKHLVEVSIRRGRSAIFAECGLGKTPMELVFADNVLRKTNKAVLILTPLAVAPQFEREGRKFEIECKAVRDGKFRKRGINITNYQQLHKYNPPDFAGVIGDESSCLKNADGKTRRMVTDFLSSVPYRLLCTATPAPNDYTEFGTSSEALGFMRYSGMLATFFTHSGDSTHEMELKGHARTSFWEWIASWARVMRKPSDLGFEDDGFILPPLVTKQHIVEAKTAISTVGFGLDEAVSLDEQRAERKQSIKERCECVASLLPEKDPAVIWCHLNDEGDMLEHIIPNSVQVSGSDSDEVKEERLNAFSMGQIQRLVTKPTIAGYGLNWQHCAFMTSFPSHSFEQLYQFVRRCWRFGQTREVQHHIVTTRGERRVLSNLKRKEQQSADMFADIVAQMSRFQRREEIELDGTSVKMKIPTWLK